MEYILHCSINCFSYCVNRMRQGPAGGNLSCVAAMTASGSMMDTSAGIVIESRWINTPV